MIDELGNLGIALTRATREKPRDPSICKHDHLAGHCPYCAVESERDRYREALEKLLPKQDPLDAECVCDYCGATVPWDEAQYEHKPDCPWLLIHPKSLHVPATCIEKCEK